LVIFDRQINSGGVDSRKKSRKEGKGQLGKKQKKIPTPEKKKKEREVKQKGEKPKFAFIKFILRDARIWLQGSKVPLEREKGRGRAAVGRKKKGRRGKRRRERSL